MWAINKKHDQYSYCTVDGDLYGGSSHSDLWRNWLRKKKCIQDQYKSTIFTVLKLAMKKGHEVN